MRASLTFTPLFFRPRPVPSLRNRFLIGLFFCLISLGQAYSYSCLVTMGEEMQCGCNLAGRKCIHGCHLKHHHDSEWAQLAPGKDRSPTWVNPLCAKQKIREVLSIQGDPFLPQAFHFSLVPDPLAFDIPSPQSFSYEVAHPLERPPKFAEA